MSSISTLESLPDEILLEICKYLLCVDVILSFDSLNRRMSRMINDYYRHVSLHKASYAQSYKICSNIIPTIGIHIRTLVIDNCYSALQSIAFPKYFENRMAICFPELKKLVLVSFRPDPLLTLLRSLNNLEKLTTIDLRTLFRIPPNQQTEVLLSLLQANDHRITSIFIDDQSSNLNPKKKYLPNDIICPNIINLKIELSTICDLSVLLPLIPNVHHLSASIHKKDNVDNIDRIFTTYQLNNLVKFQLKSIERSWYLNELVVLLQRIPSIKCLSLNLRTCDMNLINGDTLRRCLPYSIEQFHYAVHYLPDHPINDAEIFNTWKYVCPVTCLYNPVQNDYMFLHTQPYSSFDYLEISSSVAGTMLNTKHSYKNIHRIHVDCDFTLAEAFPIIGCCERARHCTIWLHSNNAKNSKNSYLVGKQIEQEKHMTLSKLSRLHRLTLFGFPPRDLHHMSTILHAAQNLIRLDLNYSTLMLLIHDGCVNKLLQERITALTINNMSLAISNSQEYIARIASVFLRLQHLYIDMKSIETSIDLLVLCYFDEFYKQNAPLVSLCADGKPSDEMRNDAQKWLVKHRNYFVHKHFTAYFNPKAGRLQIWM